ncbi:magnesium-translocating P-type ATPase [Cetobacterium somerae]|uniref:magnesium-translocating P-type ATPase n=1 Tax=Cetobacterium sp. NK01 TaxID=2993530 RepID=UPI002115D6C3|nr:magnesium-translocating P-type ATPase [Cetobacterium sp. NK01]MCQ8211039.1 magnesium-translocating P-type ATPase [Cetobacterium sp. NK01]
MYENFDNSESNIKGTLKLFSEADIKTIYLTLESSLDGIKNDEANRRLETFGFNEITKEKVKPWYIQLLLAFLNPFNFILGLLAFVSLFTDVIFANETERSWISIILILTMILISSFIKFIQEYRSSKTAEKLKNLIVTKVTVIRDGISTEIDIKSLVPGDIVKLTAGDIVPGDIRIISSKDLFISQSVLTGESNPVEKYPSLLVKTAFISELSNIVLMGTNVLSGTALGVVLGTGKHTFLNTISESLKTPPSETSFEKGIDDVSKLLIKFMLFMVPIVFLINGYLKGAWFESMLFSLSVAIGLTPEMLPMIVTGNLTKGAIELSKKKTIVKKLDSIHNFGAMNILCTDKTGTLTQDKVTVVKYLNYNGVDDDNVLYLAYLNSFFQTGLKNLMDRAILEFEEEHYTIKNEYKKIDELPFDFERRRMSVIVEDLSGERTMITKGAIEEMLYISNFVEINGETLEIKDEIEEKIKSLVNQLNEDGMRVIGIGKKILPRDRELNFSNKDENSLTFVGMLGFLDPAKEGVGETLKSLNEYGVEIKILTGDNELVTQKICKDIGLDVKGAVDGGYIESIDDLELKKILKNTTIFSKLSPLDKARVVRLLKEMGNTVGYMGDGINDAPALRQCDVGISVENGMDIAKESAQIILLEKELSVLLEGVIIGRKIFTNMIKYLKMTASSNFGNVFSVVLASAFLPFLPMLPIQILFQNLLYDISQISIPWDNVDKEDVLKPKNWSAESVGKFMMYIGPLSSIFDIATFLVMFYIFKANSLETQGFFHTGWFIESILSQTLIIHLIRTKKIPFIESNANIKVIFLTSTIMIFSVFVPYSKINGTLGFIPMPISYFFWVILILIGYFFTIIFAKKHFIKKFNSWL